MVRFNAMDKIQGKITLASIAAYTFLCCLFLQECAAQNIKAEGKPGQNYFNVVNDIKCYQIVYDENSKEYITYYQAIREKIVKRLRSNYNYYFNTGDVNLFFLLNSDGSLARLGVDGARSTDDKKLVDTAVLSLKQASPFPPFPEKFRLSQMPFSIIISFREKSD